MSKSKNIIRTQKSKEKPYVMLSKEYINNRNLSAKAKGIMTYILSLPDDWEIYVSELEKHFTDGRDAIASGLKELINEGYMTRKRKRNEKGHFSGYEYQVYEEIDDNPNKRSDSNIPTENGLSVNGLSENGKPVTTNKELKLSNNNTNNYIFPGEYKLIGERLNDRMPGIIDSNLVRKNGMSNFLSLQIYERKNRIYISLDELSEYKGELIASLKLIDIMITDRRRFEQLPTRKMISVNNFNKALKVISEMRSDMIPDYIYEYFEEVEIANASIEHFIKMTKRIELQVV